MNQNLKFTETDKLIINSYTTILDGLGEYFGEGYEMVIHSLENLDESAIKIINGHHSGRVEGAPITDLAMTMLSSISSDEDKTKGKIYFNRSSKGTPLRSATLPITGENSRIIGLLCINFYMDIPLHIFLDMFTKFDSKKNEIVETFASNSDDLIIANIEKVRTKILKDSSISVTNKNKEIITYLFENDLFDLKYAVPIVARVLGISKNTVYMHIRNLSNQKK